MVSWIYAESATMVFLVSIFAYLNAYLAFFGANISKKKSRRIALTQLVGTTKYFKIACQLIAFQ